MVNPSKEWTAFIFAILRQVDADPETSAMEMWLVYVISQMLNKKTRVCFPLQSTLAQRLRVSDRTVRQCIAGLAERGHLRVRRRGRDSSALYELVLHDRNAASGHGTGRPEDAFRSTEEQDRKSDVARPENSRRKTGSSVPTEPTSEPTSEPEEERGAPKARPRKAPSVGSIGKDGDFSKERDSSLELSDKIDRGRPQKQRAVTDGSGVAVAPPLWIDQHGNPVPPPPSERPNTTASKSNRERANAMAAGGAR
jgi:Helix-turn-helix domain